LTRKHNHRRWRAFSLVTVLALAGAACGDDDAESPAAGDTASDDGASGDTVSGDTGSEPTTADDDGGGEPVTINWWHIQNNDPGLSNWQAMADEFMTMHPNVTIDINVLENEAFKAALQTNLQAGDVPDLFQSWGGGGLREQVDAGLVQDITAASSELVKNLNPGAVGLYNIDGKQYGIPFNLGMVGFWYNKDLFAQAGIEAPPTTWDELLDVVQQLKDAGITPIAVGAGDKWPAHFYYSYLMVRLGGADVMNGIAADGNFNVPEVIAAGEELKRLIDMEPFQPGFLAAPWDGADGEAGAMGNGLAAMDLMGQWAPGTFRSAAGVPEGELPFELGWFPFPMVEGGAGAATDAFGGGDGFAVGKDAPPEAVEFLEFITNVDNAKVWGESGSGLPVTKGAEVSITDPNMQMVLAGIDQASFVQLYLDQFFTPDVGAAVNDAVQTLFAGTATPEEVATAITAAAAG
jgi:raffinose/stachyose/melibiose transport system substrate-binding protein